MRGVSFGRGHQNFQHPSYWWPPADSLFLVKWPWTNFFWRKSLPEHPTCMLSCFNCVWLFVTPWTVAHQAPLSWGFSSQGYWSGLQFLVWNISGGTEISGRFLFFFLLSFKSYFQRTSSVQFSGSVMSDSLWPHGLQHTRLPCTAANPKAY